MWPSLRPLRWPLRWPRVTLGDLKVREPTPSYHLTTWRTWHISAALSGVYGCTPLPPLQSKNSTGPWGIHTGPAPKIHKVSHPPFFNLFTIVFCSPFNLSLNSNLCSLLVTNWNQLLTHRPSNSPNKQSYKWQVSLRHRHGHIDLASMTSGSDPETDRERQTTQQVPHMNLFAHPQIFIEQVH